jgi:coenzyme F420-dependent glucose-6-phosphate dehydrogenase
MVLGAYCASHEQFPPSARMRYVRLVEQAGFTRSRRPNTCSPKAHAKACVGLPGLGRVAMQVTSFPYSSVCTHGPCSHPVIIAQASAPPAFGRPGVRGISFAVL